MRSNRVFLWLRKFNTLLPFGIILVLVITICYGFLKDFHKPESLGEALSPGIKKKTFLKLRRHEYVKASSDWVLSLDADSNSHAGFDGQKKIMKNILVSNSATGISHWIFPNQSTDVYYFDLIKDSSGAIDSIYLNTASTTELVNVENDLIDVYLARPYEGDPVQILLGASNVISHQVVNKEIHIIYEKQDGIRAARFSLKNFKQLSDKEITKKIEAN